MTTIKDLSELKKHGQKWVMLTAYEQMAAEIFDEAGIPVLLVGDSAGIKIFIGIRTFSQNYSGNYL